MDYSSYFETENGAVGGYVLSTTGAFGSDTGGKIVTDYISTKGLLFLKAYPPYGSSAGIAFYDENKNALTNYQGTGRAGYGYQYDGVTYSGVWKEIPANAAYMRVTCIYATNHELYVIREKTQTEQHLLDALSSIPKIRSTKVIWRYKDFGLVNSRVTLQQETLNEDARQIKAKYEHYLNRSKFEISFTPNDANCFIGVGCEYAIQSEVRVSGNTFTIRCGSSASDTYVHIDPVVIFTYTLPFTLAVGKTYKIGYIKRDASLVNNDYVDNATFFVDDCEGHRYEKTIEKTASASNYNGVSGRYSTLLLGTPFVSLKQGEATINNIVFASDYAPRAKCLLTGDSFVAGDTMTDEGQRYKYAALLQQAIGIDEFVIVGMGGEEVRETWMLYITECICKYYPEYVIISLGTNNHVLSVYEDLMNSFITWLTKIGIKPVLVTITPYKIGSNDDARKTFREAANSYVRNSGYRYIDICKAVTYEDSNGTHWISDYVKSDGVHPSKAGHQAIYEAFVRELPEIFNV